MINHMIYRLFYKEYKAQAQYFEPAPYSVADIKDFDDVF